MSRWVTPCIEQYAEDLGERCIGGGSCHGSSPPAALHAPCLFHFVNCNFHDWKKKYENVHSRTQSVYGFADSYAAGSKDSADLQAAIDAARFAETSAAAADDLAAAASVEQAKAERALRIAYREKIVYGVTGGERGAECLADGRVIRAEVVSSVCTAADAARGW